MMIENLCFYVTPPHFIFIDRDNILTVVCVYLTLTVSIMVRLFAMLGFSVIIVAPTVKDSY